jgi:hypothetical protein
MAELINEKLTDFDFYKSSMSLFLKNSPGMSDRCEMFVEILNNINDSANSVFNWIDIYNENYPENANSNANLDSTNSFWLNLIGEFLGISRYFNKDLVLTDSEFLKYIQATIQKYIFDGTRQSLREAYYGTKLLNWDAYNDKSYPQIIKDYISNIKRSTPLNDLGIQYIQARINGKGNQMPGVCEIIYNSNSMSANLKTLFNNGNLTIESLGVTYLRGSTYVSPKIAKYDTAKYYGKGSDEIWVYGGPTD